VYVTYQYDVDSSLEGPMARSSASPGRARASWVLDDLGTLFQYNQADLAYVGKTTAIAAYITSAKAGAGLFYDGTSLVVTTASGTTGTDQVRLVEVHDGGRVLVDPELQRPRRERVHGDDPRRLPGQRPAQRNAATYWTAIGGASPACTASMSRPARTPRTGTSAWPASSPAAWPTTGRRFRGWAAAAPTSVWTFTTWGLVSPPRSRSGLAYSWYDDVGTVHETRVGPRATSASDGAGSSA